MTTSDRGRANEARRNDRAVLDAARRLVARHGAGTSVADIAADAGVGVGSLYRRYPSKEALLADLCRRAMEQWLDAVTDALSEEDPWEALAGFIREAVAFRAGVLEIAAGIIRPTREMQAQAQEGFARLEELVARASAAGVVHDDVTAMDVRELISLFSRRADDEATDRLLTLALRGIHRGVGPPLPGVALAWSDYVRRWAPS